MAEKKAPPPPAKWAQRKDRVLLTFELSDVTNPKIDITDSALIFRGNGGTEKKDYYVQIDFFKDVNPQESKQAVLPRKVYFEIKKKDVDQPFWPRLTKDSTKHHWLKTDFNLWVDEDDSDVETQDEINLESMMNSMGGLGGADLAGEEEDSDDEDMPDLESTPSSE
ncbi:uncharacterized protein LOC135477579 isoform X3 [Liolophura sinensis]|uniref:uncharacterized protein LOC135477579 isoform X3 n=1 Tax=Liolophura sinensis TaxID=3198878 RepID=UPI003158405B